MNKKKNIAITLQEAKEWYKGDNPTLKELALKAFTKEELKKQELPKTWEEHCMLHAENRTVCYYIGDNSSYIYEHIHDEDPKLFSSNKNLCQTKKDAEAFLALMQLRALWHNYVGDFKFNWERNDYYGVHRTNMEQITINRFLLPRPFCFPTQELAEEFLNNFKDLFEIAKPLI